MPDERMFYSDDCEMLHDLLLENWDTGIGNTPQIVYKRESQLVNSRVGSIYIQRLTRTNSIDSTDYHTFTRHSYLSVKISNRDRDMHFKWCEEFYRIILENRRAGPEKLNGWLYIEITAERPSGDLDGWYADTFDLRLTRVHRGITSDGFGSSSD